MPVLQIYDITPGLQIHLQNNKHMKEAGKALNILYVFDRSYEPYLVHRLFPIQLALQTDSGQGRLTSPLSCLLLQWCVAKIKAKHSQNSACFLPLIILKWKCFRSALGQMREGPLKLTISIKTNNIIAADKNNETQVEYCDLWNSYFIVEIWGCNAAFTCLIFFMRCVFQV